MFSMLSVWGQSELSFSGLCSEVSHLWKSRTGAFGSGGFWLRILHFPWALQFERRRTLAGWRQYTPDDSHPSGLRQFLDFHERRAVSNKHWTFAGACQFLMYVKKLFLIKQATRATAKESHFTKSQIHLYKSNTELSVQQNQN